MKEGTITFRYFEKGDYVRTPEGVGIVVKDEKKINDAIDLVYGRVKVQHKHGISYNPSNNVRKIERNLLIRITKKKYNGEKEN